MRAVTGGGLRVEAGAELEALGTGPRLPPAVASKSKGFWEKPGTRRGADGIGMGIGEGVVVEDVGIVVGEGHFVGVVVCCCGWICWAAEAVAAAACRRACLRL